MCHPSERTCFRVDSHLEADCGGRMAAYFSAGIRPDWWKVTMPGMFLVKSTIRRIERVMAASGVDGRRTRIDFFAKAG